MRTPLIAGNWKMNMNVRETEAFMDELTKEKTLPKSVEAALCAPFIDLTVLVNKTQDTDIKVGAQNVYFEENGAYTGEISASMLSNLGLTYVITGHSERRQLFFETDEDVNKKNHAVLEAGMFPITCVGETQEERNEGQAEDKVRQQVTKGFEGISRDQVAQVVIAYEPIWAIGTGQSASSDDANQMCEVIRNTIENLYDSKTAQEVRILYGGSVKPATIEDLMRQTHVDGALVGGASLKVNDFVALLNGSSHD
ncbi:triose-phosphate isomerase [Jeotgalicoccus huakuii]|nr:triose-phosphate isomerase [Jeotgalicoccus huakuii]